MLRRADTAVSVPAAWETMVRDRDAAHGPGRYRAEPGFPVPDRSPDTDPALPGRVPAAAG